jgi:hypothetical protein
VLLGLTALLTMAAIWVTRPGNLLGGAEPISASLVYAHNADGIYVYRLQDPLTNRTRAQATLQSIYDAHKAAAAERGGMVITLLRETAPVTPFVTGSYDPLSKDIAGRVVVEPERHVATLRPRPDAPMADITLDW